MSAAVNSQTVHNERLCHTSVLALCSLLFFFTLHAKIAVYSGWTALRYCAWETCISRGALLHTSVAWVFEFPMR